MRFLARPHVATGSVCHGHGKEVECTVAKRTKVAIELPKMMGNSREKHNVEMGMIDASNEHETFVTSGRIVGIPTRSDDHSVGET